MKKILLFTDTLAQGGAERQMVNLAVGLIKRGCKVRLVSFYSDTNFYSSDLEESGLEEECIPKGKNGLNRAIVIRSLVKQWNPDLVVSYKSGSSMAACLARMTTKFNLAVSERNTNQEVTIRDKLRFFLYKWADHIVPNSFSQAEFIKKIFPTLYPKVSVITNMVNTEKFRKLPNKIVNEIPQVITTARVAPQKNLFNYLESIKILKDKGIKVHFNWFGRTNGYQEYWDQVKNKISDLGIDDYVTFHGATKDVVQAYNDSDIFLLPSLYEGFPNVLCEAMACKLPCIATNVCDSPYILNDKKWLCNPNNPKDIAKKIEMMISLSQTERKEIGIRNRRRIISLCSENEFIDKYLSLVNN